MEELLKALMKKKKAGPEMDPSEKSAKMGVLKQIHDMASNDMGHDISGIKKVTVAAPDEDGLKMGLDKAKEVVDQHGEEGSPEEEAEESPEEEEQEDAKPDAEKIIEDQINHESAEDELSPEEMEELIKVLQQKLSSKK